MLRKARMAPLSSKKLGRRVCTIFDQKAKLEQGKLAFQSCQIAHSGVGAERPEWSPLSRKEMLKESALHHRIYCVCPLCSQHKEILENDVKSGSLVTLNRLFSMM